MKQRVTIYDIARAAGVSQQTVSRALNSKGYISPNTQKRILDLSKEMGYRPNRMAKAMRESRSYIIGLVVPDINNPFYSEVVRGVQDSAKTNGYNTLICNTDHSVEIAELNDLVSHGVDGLISFTQWAADQAVIKFADDFGPLLLINREFSQLPEHPHVTGLLVDNEKGAMLAVEHLIELGHTKIAKIGPKPNHRRSPTNETRRTMGYWLALNQAKIEANPALVVDCDETLTGGYHAAKELLTNRPDVTAIFAYNDMIGLGAMRACHELQLLVPADISIIGYDDIQMASMVTPSLSSIHVDKYNMGRVAFERVFSLIEDPDSTRALISIEPKLVVRESTGAVKN